MAARRIPGAARRGKANRTERGQARDIGGSSERGVGEDSRRRLAAAVANSTKDRAETEQHHHLQIAAISLVGPVYGGEITLTKCFLYR